MPSAQSIAPLGANETWAGDWVRRDSHHLRVEGSVFSDKAGKLHVEQSSDGVNADVDTEYEIAASDGKGFTEPLVSRFWRLKYVNGGTKQGALRISGTAQPADSGGR